MADDPATPTPATPPPVSTAPKSGWLTSEHLLTLIVVIIGSLMTSGLIADGSTVAKIAGAAMATLSAMGYAYNRTQLKLDSQSSSSS